jgi:hypothetical protein
MKTKIIAASAALAFALAGGSALAQETMATVSVEGTPVEVSAATAADACGLDVAMVEEQAGMGEPVCEIDMQTAQEYGIDVGGGTAQ